MNKELKIIESYYPPADIGVIWYDKRANKLKKVVNYSWTGINEWTTPLPTMPGDDELVIKIHSEDVEMDWSEYIGRCVIGAVKEFNIDWIYDDNMVYCKIIVKLEEGEGSNIKLSLDPICDYNGDWIHSDIHVLLPANKTVINQDDLQFNSFTTLHLFLNKKTKTIERSGIKFIDGYCNLVLLQEYPPTLAYDAIVSGYSGEGLTETMVFVPEIYMNMYRAATNWSYTTITPITELSYD